MRADTHDGPEQMLHVRGLIHCCSSHVRRSWNSVLQRTAGPYIMAQMRSLDVVSGGLNTEEERTWYGHARSSARDLEPTSKVRRGGTRRSVNRPFAPSLFHPCW